MRAVSTLLVALLCLTACGAPAAQKATGKIEVTSCGRNQLFTDTPKRVLVIHQHPTEMLVALGLTDKIVGMAYPDDKTPPQSIAADYNKVKLISEKAPSFEQVLAAEPDLVVGGYTSAFDEKQGLGRQRLEDKGIRTLLLSESCSEGAGTMEQLTTDLSLFGKVFGIQDRAKALSDNLTGRIAKVQQAVKDKPQVPVFFYDSGQDAPLTVGRRGLGNALATAAGGKNIFDDVDKAWGKGAWEQVAAKTPQAVVFLDYLEGGKLDEKQKFLESQPLASATPGVKAKRYATVSLMEMTEGIRVADTVEKLAKLLHPESMK
ncbi:iron ABC transporter substrate-binding protein [Pseudonocardiaceae bacterium YIM PH 21723]|nr:iron ABC transporter substrate-binding protein [Pseudonocardiaceae bacterium YIM PH 21723]